jgi:hypothetical protein
MTEIEIEDYLTSLRPKFRQAITQPERILELLSAED